jgi:uncharacterized protein YecE (DUF72 family)
MAHHIHIGCCGWSYLNEGDFRELKGSKSTESKLQSYAKLFDAVEINSTFYRLPRLSTVHKWREEVDGDNPGFEFTVKAFQGITHFHRFQKQDSLNSYAVLKDICAALRTRLLLFQSPASFKPTQENIDRMRRFFGNVDREGIVAVWEPRGKWYDEPEIIENTCAECNLVHCVDPFRNDPLAFGEVKIAYFRLHGFGKPSMYRYGFSDEDLILLRKKVRKLPKELEDVFVFFNNDTCYQNGRSFQILIRNPDDFPQ